MMMDCPRCGFSQPKDRYCANCGLDVETFRAKPKPLFLRLLQNPNFHLGLIVLLIVAVAAFLLLNQRHALVRGAERLRGTPLSSREAADPEALESVKTSPAPAPKAPTPPPEPVAAAAPAPPPSTTEKIAQPEPKKLDLSFWEVQREVLVQVMNGAERMGEGSAGRAFLIRDGAKTLEALKSGARRLSANRAAPLQTGSQILVVTPPTTQEPFQVGLAVQLAKWENKEALLRWDVQLVLSQPETPQEAASTTPTLKAAVESTLIGGSALTVSGLIAIVLEPNNRHPREEYLSKAGEGPWSIFSSENFRNGLSDWLLILQIK